MSTCAEGSFEAGLANITFEQKSLLSSSSAILSTSTDTLALTGCGLAMEKETELGCAVVEVTGGVATLAGFSIIPSENRGAAMATLKNGLALVNGERAESEDQ